MSDHTSARNLGCIPDLFKTMGAMHKPLTLTEAAFVNYEDDEEHGRTTLVPIRAVPESSVKKYAVGLVQLTGKGTSCFAAGTKFLKKVRNAR